MEYAYENTVMVREAVGVFQDPDALQSTLDELETNGFRRDEISVLAPHSEVQKKLMKENPGLHDIMENPATPRAVFIPKEVMGEIFGSIVGLPLYIGAIFGGFLAIVEQMGWLYIIFGLVAGGLAGAFIGGFISYVVSQWWEGHIRRQLRNGGLVMWVNIRSPDQESKAWRIMSVNRARYLHVHDIPAG